MAGHRTTQFLLQRSLSSLARRPPLSVPASRELRFIAGVAPSGFLAHPPLPCHNRCFSQTPILPKGKTKSASAWSKRGGGEEAVEPTGPTAGGAAAAAAAAPVVFTFDDVDAAWDRAEARALERLPETGSGGSGGGSGRFHPEALGQLAVRDKATGTSTALRELAVVVPGRGRTVEIRLHSAAHRKAVLSAVQASDAFNQQPQVDPDNELVLRLKLEAESVADQTRRAREACHEWRERVREVTRRRRDGLKGGKAARTVGADDFRRLEKELLKLQDGRLKAVEAREKEVIRAIEARHGML